MVNKNQTDNLAITNWRKSSRCTDGRDCVEIGWARDVIGIRDTKYAGLPDAVRPVLALSHQAGTALLDAARSDLLSPA